MAITAAERALVRRPALEERLDEAFGRRLTLVVAEAGYGKSTLVAQWSEELERAWHTVSTSDLQLSALAAGLAAALRPWLGELPEGFQSTLAGGHDELARAEVVAGQLSEALGRKLSHDIVLVLDDAHTLSS